MKPHQRVEDPTRARLLLVLLALSWGLSWPVMKIALDEIGVIMLRGLGYSIAAVALFATIALRGRRVTIPRGVPRLHVLVAGVFNVLGLGLFSSFAQMSATTSRVVIVTYSMPIWSTLMARVFLGERLNSRSVAGLVLCFAGLATLVYPIATAQSAIGLLLALACSLCWAAGTVYMKWARIPADLLAVTAWQIAGGAVVIDAAYLIGHGVATFAPVSLAATLAVLYTGLVGTGVAYLLWFAIIERLSTATASLGSLITPVLGVVLSMVILSERPTVPDMIGFGLILGAAACVLLQPRRREVTAEL